MKAFGSYLVTRLLRKPPIDQDVAGDVGRDGRDILERGIGAERLAFREGRRLALAFGRNRARQHLGRGIEETVVVADVGGQDAEGAENPGGFSVPSLV